MPINGEQHMDCPGLVIVGGMHGSGKTTLVGEIIEADGYVRMPALSTRARRSESDNEYTNMSHVELEDMMAEGLLLNLDEVNGEYYAVARADLDSLHAGGLTAVKEIHPDNFHKFEGYCGGTFPVVLVNQPFVTRVGRSISPEDNNLGDSFNAAMLGKMVLALTDFNSTADAAAHVVLGHSLEMKYRGRYPDPRRIDEDNQATYSALAPVFVDALRLTTRDFHEASVGYLARAIAGMPAGSNVLEIGTGTSWLEGAVDLTRFNMMHQESSESMYRSQPPDPDRRVWSPVRKLPIGSGAMDCIIGSLVDGTLYPQALLEMQRVLKDDGRIILSYPSRDWAEASRGGTQLATFIHQGVSLAAHSFSPRRDELEALLKDVGFTLEEFIHCPPADRENSHYSPALFDANGQLPNSVVSIVVARKEITSGSTSG